MSEATENTTDTTESSSPQSPEDKFFGVTTQITKSAEEKKADNGQTDLEFEIVEEGQPEDSNSEEVKATDDSDISEDELENYSERVQKRINKLRYEQHEERRKKEAAEQMREEAVKVAQQLASKNREYESLIQRGESALIVQIKERAEMAVDSATSEYRTAYEQGDTDKIIESQKSLIKAQTELTEAVRHERQVSPAQNGQQTTPLTPEQQQAYQQQAYQQQAYQQQAYQQQLQKQQPPNPRAVAWGKENPWFEDQSSDQAKLMTSLAYGLHRVAVQGKGIAPNTNDYFDFINAGMRERFTDYEWPDQGGVRQTTASTARHTSSVVAPSARNNGARPRKVKLQPTQRALAKRLGLTQEQYANQLLKEREMSHGR
mgnify:CR=1 FL=1|jgi:hypothetical protein|tara:strand:+ start:182 stop:1303 length:1122 start_codon:yes stop_codon:yes gene_type:complete